MLVSRVHAYYNMRDPIVPCEPECMKEVIMNPQLDELLDAAIGPLPRPAIVKLNFWVTLHAFVAALMASPTNESRAETAHRANQLESMGLKMAPKLELVDYVLECTAAEVDAVLAAIEARLSSPEQHRVDLKLVESPCTATADTCQGSVVTTINLR